MAAQIGDERRPIGQAVGGAARAALVMAALLLAPAALLRGGDFLWWRAIWLSAAFGAVHLVGNLALALWRPAHFRVRQQSVVAAKGKGQPRLDAIGSVLLLIVGAAWLAFIAADVFRLHLLPPPPAGLSLAGLPLAVVGVALYPIAVWENRFATPNVQDQTADGQQVVDTGVYALVRHPLYLGNLLFSAGACLWLGSTAALAFVGVLLAMTLGRIAIEERDLRSRLPQYADYARRVRGRLIPFLL